MITKCQLQNYEKITFDASYVATEVGQTILYPLKGCGIIDRIQYWTEFFVGCRFDCEYCFARVVALKHKDIQCRSEWNNPVLKYPTVSKTLDVFSNELNEIPHGSTILHSMTTDPFFSKLSRDIHKIALKQIFETGSISRILTKGLYPTDFEIISKENQFGISMTTLNENQYKPYELKTSPQSKRAIRLKKLSQKGVFTFVNITAFPEPMRTNQLTNLLNKIKFVDEISMHTLSYFGYLSEKEYDYFFQISSEIWQFCEDHDISFYTTGLLNSFVRNKLKNEVKT